MESQASVTTQRQLNNARVAALLKQLDSARQQNPHRLDPNPIQCSEAQQLPKSLRSLSHSPGADEEPSPAYKHFAHTHQCSHHKAVEECSKPALSSSSHLPISAPFGPVDLMHSGGVVSRASSMQHQETTAHVDAYHHQHYHHRHADAHRHHQHDNRSLRPTPLHQQHPSSTTSGGGGGGSGGRNGSAPPLVRESSVDIVMSPGGIFSTARWSDLEEGNHHEQGRVVQRDHRAVPSSSRDANDNYAVTQLFTDHSASASTAPATTTPVLGAGPAPRSKMPRSALQQQSYDPGVHIPIAGPLQTLDINASHRPLGGEGCARAHTASLSPQPQQPVHNVAGGEHQRRIHVGDDHHHADGHEGRRVDGSSDGATRRPASARSAPSPGGICDVAVRTAAVAASMFAGRSPIQSAPSVSSAPAGSGTKDKDDSAITERVRRSTSRRASTEQRDGSTSSMNPRPVVTKSVKVPSTAPAAGKKTASTGRASNSRSRSAGPSADPRSSTMPTKTTPSHSSSAQTNPKLQPSSGTVAVRSSTTTVRGSTSTTSHPRREEGSLQRSSARHASTARSGSSSKERCLQQCLPLVRRPGESLTSSKLQRSTSGSTTTGRVEDQTSLKGRAAPGTTSTTPVREVQEILQENGQCSSSGPRATSASSVASGGGQAGFVDDVLAALQHTAAPTSKSLGNGDDCAISGELTTPTRRQQSHDPSVHSPEVMLEGVSRFMTVGEHRKASLERDRRCSVSDSAHLTSAHQWSPEFDPSAGPSPPPRDPNGHLPMTAADDGVGTENSSSIHPRRHHSSPSSSSSHEDHRPSRPEFISQPRGTTDQQNAAVVSDLPTWDELQRSLVVSAATTDADDGDDVSSDRWVSAADVDVSELQPDEEWSARKRPFGSAVSDDVGAARNNGLVSTPIEVSCLSEDGVMEMEVIADHHHHHLGPPENVGGEVNAALPSARIGPKSMVPPHATRTTKPTKSLDETTRSPVSSCRAPTWGTTPHTRRVNRHGAERVAPRQSPSPKSTATRAEIGAGVEIHRTQEMGKRSTPRNSSGATSPTTHSHVAGIHVMKRKNARVPPATSTSPSATQQSSGGARLQSTPRRSESKSSVSDARRRSAVQQGVASSSSSPRISLAKSPHLSAGRQRAPSASHDEPHATYDTPRPTIPVRSVSLSLERHDDDAAVSDYPLQRPGSARTHNSSGTAAPRPSRSESGEKHQSDRRYFPRDPSKRALRGTDVSLLKAMRRRDLQVAWE